MITFRPVYFLSLTLSLVGGLPAHGQRDLKNIPDPDPELERKSFQVAEGFEVNLYAADPLLAKPIQMNFDARGRLWVATSETYPQIKPGQKAADKILILEDRDGDGKADRTTVFADGLLIPTGVEPGDGGAYVADSTDLVFLKDTDGDGKADARRVMLSGFGTEDTHHILHTFRWGPDGMLYFNQSIYIHSHLETPHGVRRLNAGGVWQFRPEAVRAEVFLRGFCNPWGHHFDRWGQSFVTDGAYGEGINYGLPGASYVFCQPPIRILAGLNPGSPKHCGLEVVGGRHLPPDWQGNLITNDFRGHRVCRFVLSEDGSGYASREMPELIKTTHPAFRPIDVKMGPDGAIYIADWYNPIIQHGEVDFRDPRRDVTHGRIWRVTAKGRPLVPRPRLEGAAVPALLDALKAPEDWTRHFARRVLKERGAAEVAPALAEWVRRLPADDPGHEHHLLEALWVYQSLDRVEPELLGRLLNARDPRARAAATRVVSHWHQRLTEPLALLAQRVADEHPRVRLEAIRGLAQIPDLRAAELALTALDRPVDKNLDYALWLTARDLESSWMPALEQGRPVFGGNVKHLLFALQALDSAGALRPLVGLVQGGKVAPERVDAVLTLLATLGGPEELRLVFERTLAAPAEKQPDLLAALAQAARQRKVKPSGDLNRVGPLLASSQEATRAAASRLAGLWQVETLRPQLLAFAREAQGGEALRRAAVEGLASLGGKASVDALSGLADAANRLPARRPAILALASLNPDLAARHAAALLAEEKADATDIFQAFLQQRNGAAALARALAGQKLTPDVAKLGVRAARASGRDHPALVEALTRAGNLTTGLRALTPAQLQEMVAEVQRQGDPARGELVFRRKDQQCLKCHAVAGSGGLVGPDLISLGASAPVDYLIESLLVPNKAIKENYHSLVVGLKDGRVVTGVKVRESAKELVLRNNEDQEVAVPVNQIEERSPGASLMPEGLADPLTRGELLDLVRFLSELGKVGPYSVGKARVVRRWQALEPTPEGYRVISRDRVAVVARDVPGLTWSPAYSTVSGALPVAELPRFKLRPGAGRENDPAFVRFQVEVTAPGKVLLRLNSAAGLSAWVQGNPVAVAEEVPLDLATGTHTVTLAVDTAARREALRVELEDAPGSPARAALLGGK